MSHIFENDSGIVKTISEQLEKIKSKGYCSKLLEETLELIVPKNVDYPIDIVIANSKKPGFFDYDNKKIEISPESLKDSIENTIAPLMKRYPSLEREIFNNYAIFALIHEVEHYYQYLIGNKYIDFPYQIVIEAYHNLLPLKIKKSENALCTLIKVRRYLRMLEKDDSLYERNANIEAFDLLCKVANYENNKEVYEILLYQMKCYLMTGYGLFHNGIIEKTYKSLLLSDLYESFCQNEDIPVEDRVRYGLPIDFETRKKVLTKSFDI